MDWPFEQDADRDHPLTKLRIAVTSSHPQWFYLVSFDRESVDPTDAEAAMLVSFLNEYKTHWYNESYLRKLAERPLDVDGGANGTVFRKYGENDWGYRRRSWTRGPVYVPQSPLLRERYPDALASGPLSLVQVMDRAHNLGEDKPSKRWLDWKVQHPEVFGS